VVSLVKQCREAAGLSMAEVARRANMVHTRLWKIEHGELRLHFEDVPRLANAIGCEVLDLIPLGDLQTKRTMAAHMGQYDSDTDDTTPVLARLDRLIGLFERQDRTLAGMSQTLVRIGVTLERLQTVLEGWLEVQGHGPTST